MHFTVSTLWRSLIWLGACWLTLTPAYAQDGFAQKAAAEALFEEGAQLLEAGDTDGACSKFQASLELDPALGTTLRLADCLDRAGKTASAWATFREAAAMARARGQQERVDIAQRRIVDLEARLSRLRLVLTPATQELPGLKVSLNGIVVPEGTWGSALPVDPGLQRIHVEAPQHEAQLIEVRVQRPSQVEVEIPDLKPLPEKPPLPRADMALETAAAPDSTDRLPQSAPAPSRVEADPGRAHRIAAYISGAAGLAALGVGGYFTYRAYDLNQRSLGHCISGEPNSCSPHGKALRDDARGAGTLATVITVAGGSALAASVVLFVVAPRQEGPSMQLSGQASNNGAALQLEGVW